MPFSRPVPSVINNPLTNSLFSLDQGEGIITPGSKKFIVTESFIKLATEAGADLTTEG